jgi:hypothetical protein
LNFTINSLFIQLSFICFLTKNFIIILGQGTWRSEFATNPSKPMLQARVVPSQVVSSQAATSNHYSAVSGFNSQSLSVNLPPEQFMHFNSVSIKTQMHQQVLKATPVNPILSQNVTNHQIMAPLKTEHSVHVPVTQSWAAQPGNLPEASDPNVLYSAYQSRHAVVVTGPSAADHVMPGPTWDGNRSAGRYTTDTWGPQSDPSRTGESSASWGYNQQKRDGSMNYADQWWYSRDHDRRRWQ